MPYVWPRSDQNEVLILCHYLLPSRHPKSYPYPYFFLKACQQGGILTHARSHSPPGNTG